MMMLTMKRLLLIIRLIAKPLLVACACIVLAGCSLIWGPSKDDKAWAAWVDSLGCALDRQDTSFAQKSYHNALTYASSDAQKSVMNAYDAILDCQSTEIVGSYISEFEHKEGVVNPTESVESNIEVGLVTRLYEKAANIYDVQSDMESAIEMQDKAAYIARRSNFWDYYYRTECRLLALYERVGDYDASANGYLSLLPQCQMRQNFDRENDLLFRLCILFLRMGEVATAHIYLDEMEFVQTPSPLTDCKYWIAMACICRSGSDSAAYARSIDALNSLRLKNPVVSEYFGMSIDYVMADYFLNNGRYDLVRNAIGYAFVPNANLKYRVPALTELRIFEAKLCVREGNLQRAKEIIDSLDPASLRRRDVNHYEIYLDAASEYYAAIGQTHLAYDYVKTKASLLDSIRIELQTNGLAFKTLANRRDTTIVSNAKLVDKAVSKVERTLLGQYLWLTFAVACVALAVAAYYFTSFRRIRKRHDELERKREALAEEVQRRKDEILEHKSQLETKNKSLQSELFFAKNIQSNILSRESVLNSKGVAEHFVLFRPCFQVSGDFYWFYDGGDKLFVCAADATGHGIPGAFISMVASSILTDIAATHEQLSPAVLLEELSVNLSNVLRNNNDIENADSVDMSVLCIDRKMKGFTLSLARHIAYIVRADGSSEIVQGTKRCVGEIIELEDGRPFNDIALDLQPGDCIYLASDGFVSQFGGPDNQKFKRKRLENLLVEAHNLPADQQKELLAQRFDEWKGNCDQTDDVLLIGVRIGDLS